jgi:hypothetical protein
VSPRRGSQAAAATDATNSAGQRGTPHALNTAKIGGICRYCDSGNSRRLSDVFPVVQEIVREKIMTRSARIGLAAALLLGGATMAMAQNGPPTGGYPPARWNPNLYRQYGYTTLATILTTRLWLATGTITALPGRGGAMTRSQLVEVAESVAWRACAQSSGKKEPRTRSGAISFDFECPTA